MDTQQLNPELQRLHCDQNQENLVNMPENVEPTQERNFLKKVQIYCSKTRLLITIAILSVSLIILLIVTAFLIGRQQNIFVNINSTSTGHPQNSKYPQTSRLIHNQELASNSKDSSRNIQQTSESPPSYPIFEVPKVIWIYTQSNVTEPYATNLIRNNQKTFASKSGFQIKQIDQDNFQELIDNQTYAKIQTLKKDFTAKHFQISQDYKFSQKRATILVQVMRDVMISHVLLQNGGVLMDRQLLLTQPLDWLEHINGNPYVNRDLRDNQTEVFGFYDLKYSSESYIKNYNTKFQITKPYRMLKQLPGLTMNFIAAKKNATYIRQICNQLVKIMQDPNKQFLEMLQDTRLMQIIKAQKYYSHFSHAFIVSALRILIKQASSFNQGNNSTDNAYDMTFNYYRLSLMNDGYGPKRFVYEMLPPEQFQTRILTSVSFEQLEEMFGRTSYCVFLPQEMRNDTDFFNQLKNRTYKFFNGSFLHKMLLFEQNDPKFLIQNKENPHTDPNGPLWTTLPKKLWVIWDKGFQNASLANQLMITHIIKKAHLSGINATLISNDNIGQYLDQGTLQRIDHAIQNAAIKIYSTVKSDLSRIALVHQHGGIYIDASVIVLKNFDWLYQISRLSSNYIWNRLGPLPKFVVSFAPWSQFPAKWGINTNYNTKTAINLHVQNFFFAAEPKSQILHDWLQLFLTYLVKPYSQTERLMQESGMIAWRWTWPQNTYVVAMQYLRLTVMLKQRQLDSKGNVKWLNANHYYGAWYLNQFMGIQKYRCSYYNYFNLDNPKCKANLWLTDYSQAYSQGLIGNAQFFLKLHRQDTEYLTNNLIQNMDSLSDLHPKSVVVMNLLSHGQKLIRVQNVTRWDFNDNNVIVE